MARRRRRVRLLLPLALLVLMGFLYFRPLATYFETRGRLAQRQAEVAALRAQKARLERRLARTTSGEALARDARSMGYVRPGEQLFIVKGIDAWRKQHAAANP
ncbi:Septum formation initiator [Gaiella occulta]|uniref:Septum formation initiator n=1 Tax=Gaiella occulta TaxID=1002870 RepID=A0A7M2YUY9_9ACTN|nr:septum formation initiator family protein [Gaiella occulta]RDI73896.1 Septum formation initiator [Gaiella occulta]